MANPAFQKRPGVPCLRLIIVIFKIPADIRDYLQQHALSTPETEVCGLLSAKGTKVVSAYKVKNISKQPASNFHMQPEGQIMAMMTMRQHNEQFCAIYHSHPRSEAIPSIKDREQAAYPGTAYLIISLLNKIPEICAYHFDGENFSTMELQITS